MSSSIIVLGWPVRPIPASLIPAWIPVFLANCYTQNRVIQRSFCAAAIQSLACLLRVIRVIPAVPSPLPSFADLVRSYAPLVRGYPEFDPDEPRDGNPWHPNVKLCRQKAPGDWQSAFEQS